MDYKEKVIALLNSQELLKEQKEKLESIFPELKESEDEKIRKALLEMVHDTTGDELWVDYDVHKEEALAWLEKQKERSHLSKDEEQKPWSKEDENHVNSLLKRLEGLCRKEFAMTRFAINEDEDWLKSLKDRYTWKPSDAQMDAIKDTIDYLGGDTKIVRKHLMSLYNDLKKLK